MGFAFVGVVMALATVFGGANHNWPLTVGAALVSAGAFIGRGIAQSKRAPTTRG